MYHLLHDVYTASPPTVACVHVAYVPIHLQLMAGLVEGRQVLQVVS